MATLAAATDRPPTAPAMTGALATSAAVMHMGQKLQLTSRGRGATDAWDCLLTEAVWTLLNSTAAIVTLSVLLLESVATLLDQATVLQILHQASKQREES